LVGDHSNPFAANTPAHAGGFDAFSPYTPKVGGGNATPGARTPSQKTPLSSSSSSSSSAAGGYGDDVDDSVQPAWATLASASSVASSSSSSRQSQVP
jgi:hypothetical protein